MVTPLGFQHSPCWSHNLLVKKVQLSRPWQGSPPSTYCQMLFFFFLKNFLVSEENENGRNSLICLSASSDADWTCWGKAWWCYKPMRCWDVGSLEGGEPKFEGFCPAVRCWGWGGVGWGVTPGLKAGVPAVSAKGWTLGLELCSGLVSFVASLGIPMPWPAHMHTFKKWTSWKWWAYLGVKVPQVPHWLCLHLQSTMEQLKTHQCPT